MKTLKEKREEFISESIRKCKTENEIILLNSIFLSITCQEEEFIGDILEEIGNVEEGCANLDWISKNQVNKIIKDNSGVKE